MVRENKGIPQCIGHCTRHDEEARRTGLEMGRPVACTVAPTVASSLLGLIHSHGGDGNVPPAHEVDGDHGYAGLFQG